MIEQHSAGAARNESYIRRLLVGVGGVLVGIACLWVVIAYVDVRQAAAAIIAADRFWLVGALLTFWLCVMFRVMRWHRLLGHVSRAAIPQVSEALVVGYAMNCLLPARLGEPFRAEYTQRRFSVDRFSVFGSIVTERVLDGLSVGIIFAGGLWLVSLAPFGAELSRFRYVAGVGLALFGGIAALLIAARRVPFDRLSGPAWLTGAIRRFLHGAVMLSRASLISVVSWSLLIWSFETMAVWMIVRSVGVNLEVDELLVVVGSASFSALMPTAPGYVGSLQLVFGAVLAAFGLPAPAGVAAATLIQIVFYGSLVGVAALIVTPRWLNRVWGQRKPGQPPRTSA